MPKPTKQPWQQRHDETNSAYAHFCAYRDLGIGRSLDAAYMLWRQQPGDRNKPYRAAGHWRQECAANDWVERARQYDIYIFQTDARDVALTAVRYLRTIALRGLAALGKSDKPGSRA